LPGDAITGHAPDIIPHALLADSETAPAGPAERGGLAAAVADPVFCPAAAVAQFHALPIRRRIIFFNGMRHFSQNLLKRIHS
jgi:hypothetical protein